MIIPPVKWVGHSELSLDKEKSKRVLIYYAYPEDERYGYFTSTTKEPWEQFLKAMDDKLAQYRVRQILLPLDFSDESTVERILEYYENNLKTSGLPEAALDAVLKPYRDRGYTEDQLESNMYTHAKCAVALIFLRQERNAANVSQTNRRTWKLARMA